MLSPAGGLWDPQRGSASTQAWMPQPLDCFKRPVCPGHPHSTVCPKKSHSGAGLCHADQDQAELREHPLLRSMSQSGQFGCILVLFHSCLHCLLLPVLAIVPGSCKHPGVHGHSCRSASPHPAPASTSWPWGLLCQPGCPPWGSPPGCTTKARPWLPAQQGECTGGASFVHWELAGSLPPISHGLFLLPPAWALRGSQGDKGTVRARGPQCPAGMMPAGPP